MAVAFGLAGRSDALRLDGRGSCAARLLLSEVEAFEIETRGYGRAEVLTARLPGNP